MVTMYVFNYSFIYTYYKFVLLIYVNLCVTLYENPAKIEHI